MSTKPATSAYTAPTATDTFPAATALTVTATLYLKQQYFWLQNS